MIRFEGAGKIFRDASGRETPAVVDLDLEIDDGETLCLIGTSGSGKTTALKMVNRLVEPTSGRVVVAGIDPADRDLIALRRSIGYVIQNIGLFPHLTVAENVSLLPRLESWSAKRRRARVKELLELVGLDHGEFADRLPAELSGGQQQRVGVARALALDPPVLLMDEPFGAVDPITRNELHEEFLRLEDEVKKTVLMVTHDLPEAFKLGDRVALLVEGRLVQVGREDDFRERPVSRFVADFVRTHFLGVS